MVISLTHGACVMGGEGRKGCPSPTPLLPPHPGHPFPTFLGYKRLCWHTPSPTPDSNSFSSAIQCSFSSLTNMAYVPAPGYQPTYNPTLPYKKEIPGGLRSGMSIYIQGAASDNMKRFFVNFVVGSRPGSDIAFHFNPRFDGWDKVVFNSMQGGNWGSEEKKRSMPFRKGTAFELVFMVLDEHYKVIINGSPFYEYGHRIPVQMVTHLEVDGDLELQSINFLGGGPAPGQIPMTIPAYPGSGSLQGKPPQALPSMDGPPVFNPPVPFWGRIQGGLTARKTIVIKGLVNQRADNITINLKEAQSENLALHINLRITEGAVVRNSFMDNKWGKEERKLTFNPFSQGQYFDLSIRCGQDQFKVFANGQHIFDFTHRLSAFHKVDTVEIKGDLTLSYVQI
ncbi:galectin-4 [Macrotis lagotis]|uniref:galectin-4 n=1 Tax=Macrotis lagotis TaxID=92651 RepID=UPI003D694779